MTSVTPTSLDKLPLRHLRRGKVREVYEVDAERLLLIASDRVSAFDVVMRERIPHKGAVLTQLTAWWLRNFAAVVRHHMLSADADEIIAALPSLAPYRPAIAGRAMLCQRTGVFPVECVVRGYISENINFDRMAAMIGADDAAELKRLSLLVYDRGRAIAAERGIIIADTKFEFGRDRDGCVTLIDEVLTPDSSRFWPADRYEPGRAQPSFDKQPLRDYLDAERRAGRWNGEAPPPQLPNEIVDATSIRYLDAYRRITGQPLILEPT